MHQGRTGLRRRRGTRHLQTADTPLRDTLLTDACPYPSCSGNLKRDPDSARGRDLGGQLHPAVRCSVHGWLATDIDRPVPLTPIHTGAPLAGGGSRRPAEGRTSVGDPVVGPSGPQDRTPRPFKGLDGGDALADQPFKLDVRLRVAEQDGSEVIPTRSQVPYGPLQLLALPRHPHLLGEWERPRRPCGGPSGSATTPSRSYKTLPRTKSGRAGRSP